MGDNGQHIETAAHRRSVGAIPRLQTTRCGHYSSRKNPAVIFECLELKCIAALVLDEECGLLAGLSFKADVGRDDEWNSFFCQFVGKLFPFGHGENHAE